MLIDRYMVVQPIVFQNALAESKDLSTFTEYVLHQLDSVVQLGSAARQDVTNQAKQAWQLNQRLQAAASVDITKLKRRMRTVKTKLDTFTNLAKLYGGRYLHRYAQAARTKFYCVYHVEAFKKASEELGIEITMSKGFGGPNHVDVYVNGLTLRGSRAK